MRKTTLKAVACTIAASGMVAYCATPAASAPAAQPPVTIVNADSADAVPGRYIVVLKDQGQGAQSVGAQATAVTGQHGGRVRHTYGAVLDGYSATMSADEAVQTARDPRVRYVQQVTRMTATDAQNNPPNWGDDRVDQRDLPLDNAYTYPGNPGQGARVYVMDSGINASHADFAGRIAAGFDAVDNDTTPQDCHGHGTHVAGTAAGTTYGVAKKATIVAVRVLDCSGSATDDDLIAGMNWVKNNAVKPAVVNYSIGCRQRCTNQTIDNAVKSVIDSGVQWVQAAGNSTDDSCYYSPQRLSDAITVGNSTKADARRSDSNWGSCLDIWAPGDNIVSASYSSNTGSATMSGTSMASPHVAGAAAVYLAQNTTATPAQVRNALVTNGTTGKLSDIRTGSPNTLLYTGSLNGNPQPGDVTVTNPGDRTATVGQAFSLDNSATGGTAPYTWSATGLPAGLSLDPSTGRISGTPTTAGTASVKVTATDKAGKSGSASFTITVSTSGGGCAPVTNGTDYPIRDLQTAQSSVTVSGCSGNASATSTVAVTIAHTYVGDLVVSLVAPDGSTYVLHNRAGGSADNINRSYTVDLSGEARNGTWRLRVQDVEVNDTGKIDSWTLTT